MQSISKQRGLTAISWFFILAIIVMLAVFIIRLIPIYLDGYAIGQSLTYMETQKELKTKSIRMIKSSLMSKLKINSVYGVTNEDIYVTKKRNTVIIEVDYEVRKKVIGNLDFVVSFNKEVTIQ